MYLHWIVMQQNHTEEWIHCNWFTGDYSKKNPYAVIQNGNKRLKLTGTSANQFWKELFQAIQSQRYIIRITPERGEIKELKNAESV